MNRTLKLLNLSNCRVNTGVATHIFRSLEKSTSLEELDLSENSQLVKCDNEALGCVIDGMLNANTTLKVLNLYGCEITDQTAKHILSGLTRNTSLVTLDMGSSKLSGSCAVSLLQQTTSTLSITVSVLGFRKVKMDKGTMWCAVDNIGDANPGILQSTNLK